VTRAARLLPALALIGAACAPASQTSDVPFAGCPSDGQMGPRAAPASGPVPRVDVRAASRLAYYRSDHLGVLAPRGWHCFGLSGSNGSTLIVSPEPIDREALFNGNAGLRGPAVQVSLSYGGTSGRFSVANGIARYFPDHLAFARSVAAEGLMSEPLPTGPHPGDWIRRRSATEIEYRTPAGAEGAGTASFLDAGSEPIGGLVMLLAGDEPDLLQLSMRLAPGQESLAGEIAASLRENPSLEPAGN
jgi:hypothetical protein